MNAKVNTFLNSGLLDKYLLGETTVEETHKVETYISKYPEIQQAYHTLQHNLEIVCKTKATKAPKKALINILEKLDDTPVVTLKPKKTYKTWHKLTVAASIAALMFAGTTYIFYNRNIKLNSENQKVVDEIYDLRHDIETNNKKLDDIMRQFKQLNDPSTYKYIIEGNSRAKNLKTIAYINPKQKTSMIDVVSLPELPKEQCYQIWAELQGKMVSLGILDETDRQLKTIPYTENALGINITIEPKGGNKTASLDKSVAEIDFK